MSKYTLQGRHATREQVIPIQTWAAQSMHNQEEQARIAGLTSYQERYGIIVVIAII
jgi:hypothetical protein